MAMLAQSPTPPAPGHSPWDSPAFNLADHSPIAVIEWDPEFRVRHWNPRATEVFGWALEEVRGQHPRDWDFVHEEDAALVDDVIHRLTQGSERWNIGRNRNYRKDGSLVYCEWYNSALRDSSGRLLSIITQVLDVTDSIEVLSRLEESERRFKATFEQAAVGLAHVGVEGRWLRVNARMCEILGYTHQELMQLTFQDITYPEDLARDMDLLRQVVAGTVTTYSMEKRYIRKSGEIVWCNLTVSLVRKPDNTPDYFISVVEDISRRRRAEHERDALLAREQHARTEAEALVRRRSAELDAARSALLQAERLATAGQLAAGVGHEINNPLSYVLANLTFVLEELSKLERTGQNLQEVRQALLQTQKGAERIRDVVRDLRTFARSDPETVGPVDVQAALEFSIAMASHQLRHRAQLVRRYAPVPFVLANESRLGQVFINLLINAAQAIPEGNAAYNRVTITLRTEGERWVVVEVSDTGSGIASEHLPHIFEPFFTTKPIGVGTGLGLSVCHGIVAALGGWIQVESQPGQGSTFRVFVPVAQAPAAVMAPVVEEGAPQRAVPPRRVLVVDDDAEVIEALARIIGSPHTIDRARTGRAALELLMAEGADYDVIFCDLMMPDVTGMDLYEVIAARRPELLARVVFMSAGGFTPRAAEFLERVAPRRLDKPFDPALVRSLL